MRRNSYCGFTSMIVSGQVLSLLLDCVVSPLAEERAHRRAAPRDDDNNHLFPKFLIQLKVPVKPRTAYDNLAGRTACTASAMTIQYDAEALVGWCSLTTLFCRCRGTIFIGVFCTPVFWIVNIIHGALILSPWLVNEYNRLRAEGSGSGEGYEEFELPPLDWGVSIVGLGLLFFFMCTPPPSIHVPVDQQRARTRKRPATCS